MSQNNTLTKCPNCEKQFDSRFAYCPWCGQENKELKFGVRFVLHRFLSTVFNIDSRMLTTFRILLFKPAFLSLEYLKGKRAKYLSPIQIYLIISLIYFLFVSLTTTPMRYKSEPKNITVEQTTGKETVWTTFEEDLLKKSEQLEKKDENLAFLQKFDTNLSKGMFLMLPIMAFLFFILFRNKSYYFEHLIFAIHLQSVYFILLTINKLFVEFKIATHFIQGLTVAIFLVITYLWIRKFYKRNVWATLWRMTLFILMYSVVLSVFLAGIAVVSLLMY